MGNKPSFGGPGAAASSFGGPGASAAAASSGTTGIGSSVTATGTVPRSFGGGAAAQAMRQPASSFGAAAAFGGGPAGADQSSRSSLGFGFSA